MYFALEKVSAKFLVVESYVDAHIEWPELCGERALESC
jgi:hypothetical protein